VRRPLSVFAALGLGLAALGLAWEASAASCTGGLPPANPLPGWQAVDKSSRAGKMGSQASFQVYDGAVESMQGQGIAYFAQCMYRQASTRRYLSVDIYQLGSAAQASTYFQQRRAACKRAKPLRVTVTRTQSAGIATLGTNTLGFGARGKYVWEVTLSKGPAEQDRALVARLCTDIAVRLAR
jgi:hypothetical protein